MRARSAGWLAAATAALLAGAALADAPKAGPTCEATRPEREAANLAGLIEQLKRLERSRPPGPDRVIPLDNRGSNYGEPAVPIVEAPRQPRR